MSAPKTLLATHIASSVALLGSSIELLLAASRAATRTDPRQAHTLYELIRLLTFAIGVPLSFIALASGVALALRSRWKILQDGWVTGKLVCLLTTIAIGALLDNREIDMLCRATAESGRGGDARWLLAAGFAAQGALVLVAIALAVFKPRQRSSQSADHA
jgi:hypothetical protein